LTRREILMACMAFGALPPQRRVGLAKSSAAGPIFRDIAAEVGLNFYLFSGATGEHYLPEILGAGVALVDYDNDGDLDVYLVQDTRLDERGKLLFPPPPGWKPGNRLFRNMLAETGKLHFVDVTEEAGVGHVGYGMGVAVGDYDNDGFQDLYVTNLGHNVLYHNNGDGTFTDVTKDAGVDDPRWSTSAAWVDYDGDGLLDLFVANYVDFTVRGNKGCFASTGEPDYCSPIVYQPVPSRLFRNLGNGRFEDVSESSGIASSFGPGLGVICADLNGDGRPDIYVANDTAANCLWMNQGNGRFKEMALQTGVAFSADGLPKAGMGLALDDIDNDAHLDLLITNLSREGVTLFRNDGHGFFDDRTAQYRLAQSTFGSTGYGVGFLDYDNDGWLDLFIANGAMTILESAKTHRQTYAQRNQLFHNEGGGKGFREVTETAGPALQLVETTRAAAFGDINNDGKLDIVVSNMVGPVRLLLNEEDSGGHWLIVRLEAQTGNRFGMGAEVAVFRKGEPTLRRRAHTDGSMLSASDIRVHFGLGKDAQLEGVMVHWPGGLKEKWTDIRADRIITLRQGSGQSM